MKKRIVGKVSLFSRKKVRSFLESQKERMKVVLRIDILENRGLLYSEFDIEVEGFKNHVEYWCDVAVKYMRGL